MAAIVVVEPDSMARQLLARTLSDAGYDVVAVDGPRPALERIRRLRPPVIITELKFPDETAGDGFELLRRIRQDEHGASARIMVLTHISDRRSVVRAVSHQVCDYLLKSAFDPQQLLSRIRAAVQGEKRKSGLRADAEANDAAHKAAGNDAAADPAQVLRSLKPLGTRKEILARIAGLEEVEGFSPSVANVLKLANSAQSSLEQLIKPVMRDQGLAVKILKLANSSIYSRGERIESLQKAILRIGLDGVRQSVLAVAVIDRFSNQVFNEHINFAHFWEHSIAVGVLASRIAALTRVAEQETAFTMGLLHDVGRIIAAQHLEDVYSQVVETAAAYMLPLEQVENRMLLLSHADLAANVLRGWHLPEDLVVPITLHHLSIANIRQQAPKHLETCAVLALANRLAHAAMIGSSGNHAVYPIGPFLDALNLKPEAVGRLLSSSIDETTEMRLNLLMIDPNQQWPDVRDLHLRSFPKLDFRPLFVGPEASAFRVMCDRFSEDCDEHAERNVAVIRIESEAERAPRSSQLEQAERDAGLSNLPTIIISPNGGLRLDAGNMSRRRTILLNEPVVISRFLSSAAALLSPAPMKAAS